MLAIAASSPSFRAPRPPIGGIADTATLIGRWDLRVIGASSVSPSWLEVRLSGNRTLVGRYVGIVGSARPIAEIEMHGDAFQFSIPPQWEAGNQDLHVEGTLAGDSLSGWVTDPAGHRLRFVGRRAPALQRTAAPQWGAPIALFDGTNLARWRLPANNQWSIVNGVLTNAKAGGNLATRDTFTDFKLHLEFRYPKDGNSGVYLRGRYEAQIEDTRGQEPDDTHLGAIYGFLPPNQDAARQPGQWQSYDITLVGRLVTVVLNGRTVIAEQQIPGITGGALDSDEDRPGPILLQGDHGPVEFRNIVITPAR
jgi:3-keto-disaccharide hydrolase